jgi:protein-L-isoaspartate(D-aspartate) O-methyltransferase
MTTLAQHRRFYAELICKSMGANDERLIEAFAAVPREDFVGPGPWPIYCGSGYMPTVSDDPALLYQDVLVGLDTERGINNGQPSLHARCLAAVAPAPGESVVHVGAGSGYYTALLATLVGPGGKVTAYEIVPELAAMARKNLAQLDHVSVVNASASEGALPAADVIYVNAGATHPLDIWLDALRVGGRLIFPLTPDEGFGVMLLVKRLDATRFAAQTLIRVSFIPCMGARDEAASKALTAALQVHSLKLVQSLHRGTPADASAWCVGTTWWLSSRAP